MSLVVIKSSIVDHLFLCPIYGSCWSVEALFSCLSLLPPLVRLPASCVSMASFFVILRHASCVGSGFCLFGLAVCGKELLCFFLEPLSEPLLLVGGEGV